MRLVMFLGAAASALVALTACSPTPAPQTAADHHHELHLPPVGPGVRVTFGDKSADVVLADLPHEGAAAPLTALWKAALPSEDAANLRFDLTGSDGFHPASRPPCTRWLTASEIASAHIDVVTHDVSFDERVKLPGCYRVKAVVAMDAAR